MMTSGTTINPYKAEHIIPMDKIYEKLGTNLEVMSYRGSQAHDMYTPKSDPNSIDDVDLIGFKVAPTSHYLGLTEWGSRGTMDFWVDEFDIVVYELQKAFGLLLNGNPNILSILWTDPIFASPIGYEILFNRKLFISKNAYHSFAGYAQAQLQKMESRDPADLRKYMAVNYEMKHRGIHPTDQIIPVVDIVNMTGEMMDVVRWSDEKLKASYSSYLKKGENLGYMGDKRKKLVLENGYDSKNAAHCIRLLKMCREFLEDGEMRVKRTKDRDELLRIKAGKWALVDIKMYAEDLFQQTKTAYERSTLPPQPDRKGAEALLIKLLREGIK
jgi:hypothetical protein